MVALGAEVIGFQQSQDSTRSFMAIEGSITLQMLDPEDERHFLCVDEELEKTGFPWETKKVSQILPCPACPQFGQGPGSRQGMGSPLPTG